MRRILASFALVAGCSDVPVAQPSVPSVRVVRVGGAATGDTISASGTVALRRETPLGFTSPGRVAVLRVNEGESVRPGQLLAALDTTSVGADASAARAERQRAAAELQRSAKLLKQGWVTQGRVESAQAALSVADARVRATGFQANSATISAPGAGVVLSRLVEPGQVVAAGTPVLILGEVASGYVLRVPLADRDASRTRIGAPAVVEFAPGERVVGQVAEIGGRADPQTGAFLVEIALPAGVVARSGRIGSVSITANSVSNVVAVPPAAVFAPRAGEGFVYVFEPAASKVRLRKVKIAEATDGATRVTGGIKPGEWVAISRIDRLRDGMAIKAIGPRR